MNKDSQLISKLTEKQYQQIAKIGDSLTNVGKMYLLGATESETLYSKLFVTTPLRNDLSFRDYEQIILAIANPLTREWAHDKFVEKEKKYYWKYMEYVINRSDGAWYVDGDFDISDEIAFTEDEIANYSPFDPEKFIKEEVHE